MTGATITPRAIVNAVYRALNFFKTNQQALLSAAGFETASEVQEPKGVQQ
jgi:hypothetical protein